MSDTQEREREPQGHEAGMLDYQARNAVRDLIALYGFEEAREKIAFMLLDELERPRPRLRREVSH